jgi:hypothetical protein
VIRRLQPVERPSTARRLNSREEIQAWAAARKETLDRLIREDQIAQARDQLSFDDLEEAA